MKPEAGPEIILANWDAPTRVKALCTTRESGISLPPYDSLNLALHVGDEAQAVSKNRQSLCRALDLPSEPCWLEQTHSSRVAVLEREENRSVDAAITREVDTIAVIMTADCLPILLSNRQGSEVAAIHAGWRGLVNGVVEASVARMQSANDQLLAWIGPGISQPSFEIGDEVREAFLARDPNSADCFDFSRPGHWYCDLVGIAADTLANLGLSAVFRADYCSYDDEALFYSYRRNAVTGRMASLIWIDSKA